MQWKTTYIMQFVFKPNSSNIWVIGMRNLMSVMNVFMITPEYLTLFELQIKYFCRLKKPSIIKFYRFFNIGSTIIIFTIAKKGSWHKMKELNSSRYVNCS